MSKVRKSAGPNRCTGWMPTHGAKLAGVLLVLLFTASGVVSYYSVHTVSNQDQQVDQVHGALIVIGNLSTDLNGTEADAFNYVITGRSSELAPYVEARYTLNHQLSQLRRDVMTRGIQQQRITKLQRLIPAGISGLNSAVAFQQSGKTKEAQRLIAAGAGVDLLNSSRYIIGQMVQTEQALLERVTSSAITALHANSIILLLVFLGDLILVGIISVLVRQTILLREALAEERTQARTQMELEVLRETTRRMDEFISIASHEFRTPLAVLKANLQLIARRLRKYTSMRSSAYAQEERDPEPVPDLELPLDRAVLAADRLDRLTGDLLYMSRIRAGELAISLSPSDLSNIVTDCVRDMQVANPDRTITLELPDGPTPIKADPERICQTLTNYVDNALKFSSEAEPIYVALRQNDGQATVSVQDFGPGLPEEQRDSIWNRFHRVPNLSHRNGSNIGLGLGLYIAASIIEQHGGTVGVESEVGKGSTFWFTIPLSPLAPASRPPERTQSG